MRTIAPPRSQPWPVMQKKPEARQAASTARASGASCLAAGGGLEPGFTLAASNILCRESLMGLEPGLTLYASLLRRIMTHVYASCGTMLSCRLAGSLRIFCAENRCQMKCAIKAASERLCRPRLELPPGAGPVLGAGRRHLAIGSRVM